MSEVLIKAQGLGKKFSKSLGRGLLYGAEDMARSFFGLAPRSATLGADEFWSLQDVNFELKRGECLGLIGPNGAGKSSLLKILNGIIPPSCGQVTIRGKVGALIEVGAGFHPLLTGRENIYVNGAIIGLSRREIDRKFDAIVDFSGIEEFIDTPVKHYSSGMYVRLGFAIAIQMEPDVLLIDEILAVGDAGFRSKCYNAIDRLSERTAIAFVSHAMPMISRLATQTLLINRGQVAYQGDTAGGIAHYHQLFGSQTSPSRMGSGEASILSVQFLDTDEVPINTVGQGRPLTIEMRISSRIEIRNANIDIVFVNIAEELVAECSTLVAEQAINLVPDQELAIRARIDRFSLNAGVYKVSVLILSANAMTHYDWQKDCTTIEVTANQVGIAGQQFAADWIVVDTNRPIKNDI
ncbi:MAG: ABC transporter ATP-binding protein [Rhodocyclaceae bacterium]|jgi:lipopolysaccharide transport system ATP-binding protein|nr:ABC transporter ATP-binding protein [Rhodocyclaceae bacterium]